jgi:hypothetical protein
LITMTIETSVACQLLQHRLAGNRLVMRLPLALRRWHASCFTG